MRKLRKFTFYLWNFMSRYFGTLVYVQRTRLRAIELRNCSGVSFSVY